MRSTIIEAVEKERIIAIIRGVESKKIVPLARALYNGGIRLLEITYSANGKMPDDETAKNIEMLVKEFAGKMFIGAGTVLTEKQVDLTAQAGGKFIISPDAYEPVIRRTRESEMASMPGALTPTEIRAAMRAGVETIVGGDGTESFIPNVHIFIAALCVLALVAGAVVGVGKLVKKYKQKPLDKQTPAVI